MTTTAPILETHEVVKHFGGIAACDGASLDVADGSITALIGPNGAGKTTLFNVITGFHRPERGAIRFRGERIDGWSRHRVARRGLARTFQLTKALARMTVLENMLLAAPEQPGERLWRVYLQPRSVRRREAAVEAEARELLEVVDLHGHADEYAGTLSGGQRKLLEFARALMSRPHLVLLDEPMAGVNPTLGLRLLDRMEQLRAERGITFLFIEHDMEVVMTVSDRVIVMNQGRVIADGTPDQVREDRAVVDAYLGTGPAVDRRAAQRGGADPPGGRPPGTGTQDVS
jgi:neutral amino acid transport system ATP-binding protein